MKDVTILKIGITDAVVAALCCATLILVITLGALGLSAWLGWLDYVLLPPLAIFIGLTAFGFWRRQRTAACCEINIHKTEIGA
jgi:mercuric ion transport protein